jgi:hypothetical protein
MAKRTVPVLYNPEGIQSGIFVTMKQAKAKLKHYDYHGTRGYKIKKVKMDVPW